MSSKDLRTVYSGVDKSDPERRENDLYETPPLATYILHKYGNLPDNIVEPCAGRGSISVELERCGYTVKSYDLNTYPNTLCDIQVDQDVLQLPYQEGYEAFVTNPPYFKNLPLKIAQKGIDEYQYTALFVRLTYLEGINRRKLFEKSPPNRLLFISDRVKFKPNLTSEPIEKEDQIGGMIAYAWVIWDKKSKHENTAIKWVNLSEEYDEWREHYERSKK
jgi:hypothetical protein